MVSPGWFTKELFENALIQTYKEKEIKILGYNCTSVVPTGDNYTSDLYRATVTFKKGDDGNKEVISVIVKSSPRGGLMEELAKNVNLFEKEIHMFSRILPTIHERLEVESCLSSRCYYVHIDGSHSLLLLEDLKQHGFIMHPRQDGLDLVHCEMVMERIAKLHAASVVLHKKKPSLIYNIFKSGIYCDDEMLKEWTRMSFTSCYKYISKWDELRKYAVKMEKMENYFYEKVREAASADPNGFNVLNHGDLWVNNLMFRYNPKGKLEDMRFVDFQLCIYSSPAVDLHYFLATSPSDIVRKENLDHLLDYYYSHLLTNLAKLEYSLEDVPSRENFLDDFKKRAMYGLMAAVSVASIVKADHRSDANFESLMQNEGEGSFREHCYTNDRFKALMLQLLPYYDSLDVFE